MLVAGIFGNLGLLFVFKYFNFFASSLEGIARLLSIQLSSITLAVVLPVGISFYTFQALSYIFDVYLGKIRPEKHFGMFALYHAFFPQLIAGPIERAGKLLPALKRPSFFSYERSVDGLRLIGWGFFKKAVIADNLSYFVASFFSAPGLWLGFNFVFATVFFGIQLYSDILVPY